MRKSFEHRRKDLIGSLEIIENALVEYEKTHSIYHLRSVAIQLRALIIRGKSSSLAHPLLIELAEEKGFPLRVFARKNRQAHLEQTISTVGEPILYYGGDGLSLTKDEMYSDDMELTDVLKDFFVLLNGEHLSLETTLRLVMDTESAHYDPEVKPTLETLKQLELGGTPAPYRTVYSLAKVVCDLAYRFIEATI